MNDFNSNNEPINDFQRFEQTYGQNDYQQPYSAQPYQQPVQTTYQQPGYGQTGYPQNTSYQYNQAPPPYSPYPQQQYQPYANQPYGFMPPKPINNTPGFILGISSIFISEMPLIGLICAIIGLVLSIKSKKDSNKPGNCQGGLVIPGIVCSAIGLFFSLLITAIFIFAFAVAWNDIDTYDYDNGGNYGDYGDYGNYGDYGSFDWGDYGDKA